ncbi:hypothetical protein [Thermospira aquatica]|uniref:Uncharacterized protein n=1 Tax=Thermospira aquatica TaxID=2828656 RepID=A0AAX3BEC4_9SPIR|nr:hypothetical protein [Thermospira aquatica]URA10404.1 hypothetical protein KDW03_00955 [Thermospira aquatica]
MNSSVMVLIGGAVVGVLFLIVLLMGLRILPGGLVWHKRLGILTMILAVLHAIGGILNFLGLLPF